MNPMILPHAVPLLHHQVMLALLNITDSGSSALDAQMAEMGFGDKEIGNMTPEQKQEIVTLLTSINKFEVNSKWASEVQYFQFQP